MKRDFLFLTTQKIFFVHRTGPGSPTEREKFYPLKQIMSLGFIFTIGQIPAHSSPHRERGAGKGEELILALVWFDGGASSHDTVKYIAALFVEGNASENNHRRASNDWGGERDEIARSLFHSSIADKSNAKAIAPSDA